MKKFEASENIGHQISLKDSNLISLKTNYEAATNSTDNMVSVETPSGTADYKLISAFSKDDKSYAILDSGKKDANGLTIVYVCTIEES